MTRIKHWKSILLFVLVFLAGGVAGSLITDYVGKRAFARAFDFDRWPDGMIHGLESQMTLTADQKVKLRVIGEELAKEMKGTLDGAIADSGRIIVDTQREVDLVLTPEQRIVHARMKSDFRKGLKEGLGVTLPEQ
jgi:hypothetical protein